MTGPAAPNPHAAGIARLAQAPFERLELRRQLSRQLVAELGQVLP